MSQIMISALPQLEGVRTVENTNELVGVDKSETTMAASGTNNRVQVQTIARSFYDTAPPVYSSTNPTAPGERVNLFVRDRTGRRVVETKNQENMRPSMIQRGLGTSSITSMGGNVGSATVLVMGTSASTVGSIFQRTW